MWVVRKEEVVVDLGGDYTTGWGERVLGVTRGRECRGGGR